MATEQFDIDQPVEFVVRGDAIDVIGVIEVALNKLLDDDEIRGRTRSAAEDIAQAIQRQHNPGYFVREMKRALNNEDAPEYRGFQVLLGEFDAQHPRPHGESGIGRLQPLEEMEWYAILGRSEKGFEAAAYPDRLDVESSMLMASFIRQYARDLEAAVAVDDMEPEDLREGSDGE